MFTHSKEKPNRCQFCNKGFACDSNRKKHELVHLDNKVFKCKVPGCKEGFNYYTSLQMHVQSVHCDEKFGCSLCAKRYSSVSLCCACPGSRAHTRVYTET